LFCTQAAGGRHPRADVRADRDAAPDRGADRGADDGPAVHRAVDRISFRVSDDGYAVGETVSGADAETVERGAHDIAAAVRGADERADARAVGSAYERADVVHLGADGATDERADGRS